MVLKKVNDEVSPGELSSWYCIPSENSSLSSFICPIRLTSAAGIVQYWREGRGTKGRNSHGNRHPIIRWHFFSFTSSSDGKVHDRQNSSGTARLCWWCALACILCTFAEKKRGMRIRFEHVLIWFGEEQAGEENVRQQLQHLKGRETQHLLRSLHQLFHQHVFNLQQSHESQMKREPRAESHIPCQTVRTNRRLARIRDAAPAAAAAPDEPLTADKLQLLCTHTCWHTSPSLMRKNLYTAKHLL